MAADSPSKLLPSLCEGRENNDVVQEEEEKGKEFTEEGDAEEIEVQEKNFGEDERKKKGNESDEEKGKENEIHMEGRKQKENNLKEKEEGNKGNIPKLSNDLVEERKKRKCEEISMDVKENEPGSSKKGMKEGNDVEQEEMETEMVNEEYELHSCKKNRDKEKESNEVGREKRKVDVEEEVTNPYKRIKEENEEEWEKEVYKEGDEKHDPVTLGDKEKVQDENRIIGMKKDEETKGRSMENENGEHWETEVKETSVKKEKSEGRNEEDDKDCKMNEQEEETEGEVMEKPKREDGCDASVGEEIEQREVEGVKEEKGPIQDEVRTRNSKEEYKENPKETSKEEDPDIHNEIRGVRKDEDKEEGKKEKIEVNEEESNGASPKLLETSEDGNENKKVEDVKQMGDYYEEKLPNLSGEGKEVETVAIEVNARETTEINEPTPSLLSHVLERHKPRTWSEMPPSSRVEIVSLSESSDEYFNIKRKVGFAVNKICRIQNPYLWGSYLLKKAEYESRKGSPLAETELFHATGQRNIQSIAEGNLDWRQTNSRREKFGQGVSFSPEPDYANKYCSCDVGSQRALICARVLVWRAERGNKHQTIPEKGFDTTTGNRGSVYVKFCDDEFYPEYVIYYRN